MPENLEKNRLTVFKDAVFRLVIKFLNWNTIGMYFIGCKKLIRGLIKVN